MRRKNNNIVHAIFAIILITVFSFVGYEINTGINEVSNIQVNTNVDNITTTVKQSNNNLKIHYVEKTTTNMIQKINPIFTVNPLISKEI